MEHLRPPTNGIDHDSSRSYAKLLCRTGTLAKRPRRSIEWRPVHLAWTPCVRNALLYKQRARSCKVQLIYQRYMRRAV